MSEQTIEEITATLGNLSDDELVQLSQDERVGVQEAVAREQNNRAAEAREAAVARAENYVRYEDDPRNVNLVDEDFEPAPLSAKEVPLEDSRKDGTTLLATDQVAVNSDGEIEISNT